MHRQTIINTVVIVLLGALALAAYLYQDSFQDDFVLLEEDVKQAVSVPKPSVKESFKCEPNLTAASLPGVNEYPNFMKDMLLYRHCRNYPLILDVPDKCGGTEKPMDIFLLLVIKSSSTSYERREVLRKTWAQERIYNGMWIRTIFMLGTNGEGFEKERWNKVIAAEQKRYNDILQWDFMDTYFNLTLKQSLIFDWLDKNCRQFRFLFDGDDDIFVSTENLVDYLQSLDNDGSKHLYAGHLMWGNPIRDPHTKYFVPKTLYEPDEYAPYCSGAGYFMSRYTAMALHKASKRVPLITMEDAYMGLCLQEAKLEPRHHIGVMPFGWKLPTKKIDQLDPCFFRNVLVLHRLVSSDMFVVWDRMHDPNLKCGVSK